MSQFDPNLFKLAMRRAATAVSVVTTDGPGGRVGVTVSSFCTATADPPQMLACVGKSGPAAAAIRANRVFCVNVLDRVHRHVADSFAGRVERWRNDRFACDQWKTLATGAPVLDHGMIALDCTLIHETELSTHFVFIGHVESVAVNEGSPLLYADAHYRRMTERDQIAADDPAS
ncbi:MAG: flavin reductase [Proteobacteria bacterium]|nr:flavin reductase [Burkholderiales bacterium]